ncbi:hypothetical protein ACFWB1_16605 [Streptomyces goshikiensis]|nr:hypothetical protein [Streptomyces sp. ADI95-16]AYV31967.1 hypothetical protein EES41_35030 [Streptomyces sp. ADI95-16]
MSATSGATVAERLPLHDTPASTHADRALVAHSPGRRVTVTDVAV